MRLLLILFTGVIWSFSAGSASPIIGQVVNPDGEPLERASLTTNVPGVGSMTDENGEFILVVDSVVTRVTFTSVGYRSRQFKVGNVPDKVVLELAYYEQDSIVVAADRARPGITPIAFDNVSQREIERDYTVEEFPLLLKSTPNLHTYTDGGSPLGYSYVKIRGFDDKRVATYINGVPLNDPEDQATYFVDLPDFGANITDIQVQRGVGNSLYGDGSFGGALNVVTSNLSRDRKITLSAGYGELTSNGKSFSDIYKQSIEYASGLIDGRWVFTGRFSKQKTGGYRENSWYDGWSYYLSLARIDPRMTTELYLYGGPIRMHLAYWGATLDDIAENRLHNPLTYDNETDNFNQPHYHLHNRYTLNERATLSNTVYYIHGRGYYEQLKFLEDPQDFSEYNLDTSLITTETADLVRQQWVAKNQYGWNPRLDIKHERGNHSFGGSFYYFESEHWGQVVWAEGLTDTTVEKPSYPYYRYFGDKWVGSVFAEEYYRLMPQLAAQVTAQLRYQRYVFEQRPMGAFLGHEYDVDWVFFSPRIGLNYRFSRNLSLMTNFAVSSRTPTDAAIYDANDPFVLPSLEIESVNSDSTVFEFGDPTARSERIYDFELGGEYRSEDYAIGLNLFYLRFEDEILPYGGLDDEGNRITVNADRSFHSGMELSGRAQAASWLTLDGNFSYNHNRIQTYRPTLDGFDVDFSDKVVPGFPDYIGNLVADVRYGDWRLAWHNRIVGQQYMELQNIDSLAIDEYYVASLSLTYRVREFLGMGVLSLTGKIENLFDKKYLSGGYGGNYAYDDGSGNVIVGGWAEYYVAAERSFYTQVRLELF